MLDGVLQGQDAPLALGLVSHVAVLLAHSHHHTLHTNSVKPVHRHTQAGEGGPVPTWCLGRPTMEGKTARGASSPANPALHIPEPLSTTRAEISSSIPGERRQTVCFLPELSWFQPELSQDVMETKRHTQCPAWFLQSELLRGTRLRNQDSVYTVQLN